eukprot:CAMPEP_0170171144 /NCGR_PEP_ID=MMETSP0040_2-20121228/4246_1 /TAXON_ID=641309 /ORGANISM="Lotharella oceanica, Strain CCMP622" /LENGTH=309 /DNA_ID=CAMNT_0010411017 /DNA_START=349 /DNA_END=1278 /DNA_ORIENTATION=-
MKSWQGAPSLKSKRGYFTAVAVNVSGDSKIYAIGGRDESGSCLNTVECLDLKMKEWVEVKPMASKRFRCGATFDSGSGKIYVVGGVDASESTFDSVEMYDISTQRWSPSAPLLTRRCDAGVTILGGCLYVAGGFNGDAFINKVERCDIKTGKWSVVAPMNENRSGFGLLGSRDGAKIYAIAGFNGHKALDTMELYDIKADKWHKCSQRLNGGRFGAGMAMAEDGKKIYVVGGWSGWQDKYRCETECYDFAKNMWMSMPSTNERRSTHGLAFAHDNGGSAIYAIGGMVKNVNGNGDGKPSASVEKLRLSF